MITINEVIKDSNTLIRKKSVEIKLPLQVKDKETVEDMIDYCLNSQYNSSAAIYHNFIAAIGIAAIQIGQPIRAFFIYYPEGKCNILAINPKLTWTSDKMCYLDQEGCLSVPEESKGYVLRHYEVKFTYYDYFSKSPKKMHLKGMPAIIFQHEYDHLSGILYKDKVIDKNTINKDFKTKHLLIKR